MKFDLKSFLNSGAIFSVGNNRLMLGYGEHRWNKTPQNEFKTGNFYFPNFFLDSSKYSLSHPWLNYAKTMEIETDALLDLLLCSSQAKPDILWNKSEKKEFQKTFQDLQARFSNRELVKAVPFVFEESNGRFSSSNLAYSLINVLKYSKNYPAFVYGFWNEADQKGMLGATPELLFVLDEQNRMLQSMACAGTAPIDSIATLALSEKDLKEHQFVIDGIKQSLNSFGEVSIGLQDIINVGSLAHLVTPINLKLKKHCSFESLVYALHPTPALGAYPKGIGNEWLLNYQDYIDRERFGAPVGFVNSSHSRCYVAIRNMQWNQEKMKIGAGCGIISESILDNEWKEIQNKIQSIKGILGL